jgi:hypothetical protein
MQRRLIRHDSPVPQHPVISRRMAVQAGAIGLLGLGMNHVDALRRAAAAESVGKAPAGKGRAAIYIFLSGGLAQHDSFDPKPEAPEGIRGEFRPIATNTPGIHICEHLPQLAQRSHLWALCRSLSHHSNGHREGHLLMLTGRAVTSPGFKDSMPTPTDWPSIAAVAGAVTQPRNNLPPAVVLPDRIIHNSRQVIPGQFGGIMGPRHDPWFIEASPFSPHSYGAYPEYEFDHTERPNTPMRSTFEAPHLVLPEGFAQGRLGNRLDLLAHIDEQRRDLEQATQTESFDRYRQSAISLLTDARLRRAIDVLNAEPQVLDRYGRNSFGWSLLMAYRLVEAGVNLVQVNLGNNETWDTHGNAFPHLREKLFPPTDKALSALLDDLSDNGLLDSTMIVMAGEFGRTPYVSGGGTAAYKYPGRDHWGAVQTVFFAGGGVRGGTIVGSSDKQGGRPATARQTPENMAATIYQGLGLPATTAWFDELSRPHHIYHAEPIVGLT